MFHFQDTRASQASSWGCDFQFGVEELHSPMGSYPVGMSRRMSGRAVQQCDHTCPAPLRVNGTSFQTVYVILQRFDAS